MKNYALLSKVACVVVCLSPLVLTSCQVMNDFFGGPSYQGQDPYHHSEAKATQRQAGSNSSSSSSRTSTSNAKKTATSSSRVPVEPPSVHKGSTSVPDTSPAVNSSSTSVTVPTAPTGSPVSAPTILAPDANQ